MEQARKLWLAEKELYEEYCIILKKEIEEVFKAAAIPVVLSHRVKKDDSLFKKMLFKNNTYFEINDKAGVRAVVHFLSDLKLSDELIQAAFKDRIVKRENKMETSDEKTFGYLSIHYDIINCASSTTPLICELQLRTVCQNAWSELAHILSYKPDAELPVDIKREVNALSALMEIADNQFQIILDMINKLPTSSPVRILKALDAFFYSNIGAWYDTEMSHYFLNDIADLYTPEDDIVQILQVFIKENGKDIAFKAAERNDVLFFSQPEIVVILERLENRRFMLIDYWKRKYPLEQLEAIANAWGTSLD
ncbi:MAG: GTP pyrophosphokinase [Syntrophomonadales bacterium]